MKHSYFKTSICLVLSLFLLLSSCQKQIDTQFEEPVLKENFIAEAKAWFTTGPVAAEKKILDLPVGILQELAPQRLFARMGKMQKKLEWGNAELYNREGVKYLVVPVTTKLKKYGNDYEIAKSLVFYKEKGDEMKMNVIEVLSKKGTSLHGKSKEIIATAFLNNIKNKTDQITGINVEVFIYSEEYKNIGKYEFKNGLFASSTKKLKIDNKLGNNNNQNNSGINTESGSCQTWYIVYEEHNQNGELVYWVVLYSYQTGNCGGGGQPEEEMPEGEGGGEQGSLFDEDGDEYYIRQGSLQKNVYLISTASGGGSCKTTQHLYARFYKIRSEKDKIIGCWHIRNDVYNNSYGASSNISDYNVSNLHTSTISINIIGNLQYPDGGSLPFSSTSSISMGEVAWHL